jgi:lambda family phage tail tape measure protein
MADTTVKIEVDGAAAISTLKQLTQANKDFETSAKASVKATNEAGKGIDEMSAAVTRARPHMIQLIQDLAEGRGALKSFSAQGVDIVKSFGSVGSAMQALGAAVLSPIGMFTLLAAAVAGVAYEAVKGSIELDHLKNELSLTNNFAGITAGSINALAVSMSGGSVTGGAMRDVFMTLASSGKFSGQAMTEVAKSIKLISDLSGESADVITKELMKSFNGSISGIKELNAQYHFLTASQFEEIDVLFRNAKTQEGVALAAEILNQQLVKQTVETGTASKGWHNLKQSVSDYLTILQGLGQEGKLEDNLAVQTAKLNLAKKNLETVTKNPDIRFAAGMGGAMFAPPEVYEKEIKAIQERIAAIKEKNKPAEEAAAAKAAIEQEEQRKIAIQEANKGLSFGVGLEEQRVKFAAEKARLDAIAARQGESSVAVARANLAYNEKIAQLEAERGKTNELDPLKAGNTNARINAAEQIAKKERDAAISVAKIKEDNAEIEFRNELRLHGEKLRRGREEIDQGEIVRKQKENEAQLNLLLERRLKEMGDPTGQSARGQAAKQAVEDQKKLNNEIIRTSELQTLNQDITTKLHNKLTEDTSIEIEKLKDQRAQTLAGSNLEVKLLQDKIRLRDEEKSKIVAIQNVFGDQSKLTQQQIDDQKQLTDAVRAEYDKRRNDSENAIRSDDQITKTKEFGLEASLARISKMALTPAGIVSSVVDTMFNNMSSALNKFVDTGKLSFSNFTESVIKDLLKIALHESEVALFKAAGGASGIGAGLLSFFGGFFADGGSPPMGKASIVGENGPELFIPRTPGTIIPNDMLGGGGSVQNNNYHNYSISAIDAKSVAQLFYENRMTMFGVTEKARRELPMRTR